MKTKTIIAFFIVCLVWGTSWLLVVNYVEGWSNRGTFGDMFGAVNALFSGLAFAGIIIALIFQKDELALQRQELRDTLFYNCLSELGNKNFKPLCSGIWLLNDMEKELLIDKHAIFMIRRHSVRIN